MVKGKCCDGEEEGVVMVKGKSCDGEFVRIYYAECGGCGY